MPFDGESQIKRFEKLRSDAMTHMSKWERMAPFIAPSRVGLLTQPTTPGQDQLSNVYDSTSIMAAELMAMFIAGHTINPSQRWASFEMRDPRVAKDDETKEWLEECRDRYLRWLSNSLFYAEGPESIIDYAGFGTGCLVSEEAPQPANRTIRGFRGFAITAEKIGRFFIAEDSQGIIDTLYRERQCTVDVAVGRFGLERVSTKLRQKYEESKRDEIVKYVHAVVPRARAERSAGAKGMPWASLWIEHETKHICSESGYSYFPAAVPRYHKTPGEVFGRGRGDLAFPDIWTLNTAKRMGLEDWALKIRPPILYRHNSVFGTLKFVPGAPIGINTHNRPISDSIAPWETGSHPEVSHLVEEELRKTIRQIFFVDQILMLMEVSKSEMTAFEFAHKIALLFRLMGPVYGRMEKEYLHSTVSAHFEIMKDGRAFSPPPPAVFETDGEIDIIFQNPIAKAQKSGDAESLAMVLNDAAPLAQALGVEMFDPIDPEATMRGLMETRGFPASWTRSLEELQQLRAARQQQQETEMANATASQYAEAGGKIAPLVKVLNEKVAS